MTLHSLKDAVLLDALGAADYEKLQIIRRDMLRRIDNLLPHCGNPARAEDMKFLLINLRTLTRCFDQYYHARKRAENSLPSPEKAWLRLFAKLEPGDAAIVGRALEGLLDAEYAANQAKRQLIEAITTVLPQGG
jgi:hypothetical protein